MNGRGIGDPGVLAPSRIPLFLSVPVGKLSSQVVAFGADESRGVRQALPSFRGEPALRGESIAGGDTAEVSDSPEHLEPT